MKDADVPGENKLRNFKSLIWVMGNLGLSVRACRSMSEAGGHQSDCSQISVCTNVKLRSKFRQTADLEQTRNKNPSTPNDVQRKGSATTIES